MGQEAWYEDLRARWKPAKVRLLLIAESAPDDHGDPARRRFFYADTLGADNLFRGVASAMYGVTTSQLQAGGKRPVLERFRRDGFYLIDLAPMPVNASQASRRRELGGCVDDCVKRAKDLNPEGVAVVKKSIFPLLAAPLGGAGLNLLHNTPMAFPLGAWRQSFVSAFAEVCGRLDNFPCAPEGSNTCGSGGFAP